MTAAKVELSLRDVTVDFEEGVALCEQMGLVETMQHGEHDYVRLTQDGKNVLMMLLHLVRDAADPDNILKQS